MRALRRNDYVPRIEMMPLIDVVFLLLTFFIYSMVVMIQAQVLPVSLVSLGSGLSGTGGGNVHVIMIDRQGQLFFDREQIADAELDRRLSELADDPTSPRLLLAAEAEGQVDLFINLLEKVTAAGIVNLEIVGQRRDPSAASFKRDP